jgi:hypothetical protein
MRQHNLKVTGSLQINGENVISASELSTLSASINSKIEGLNPSQIGTGSYTASISPDGIFRVNASTIITGSLSVSSLSGSGINYLAYSGGVVTAISGTAAIKYNQEFTAELGQTTFTPSVGYISDLIDVFYNGTKLSAETDYTATNGSTIILTQGADLAGDIIEVAIYNPVSGVSNNTLRQQTTFTASAAQTTFTVNYTPGLLDVYFNGSRLSNEEYTANNGTSIILSEAAIGGEVVDIFVYSYQVGAFSGIGGQGQAGQFAYFSSQNGISGSSVISISGSSIIAGGNIIPLESGSSDLGSLEKPFRHIYVGTGSIFLVDNSGQVTNTISAQTIVTTDTLASGTIDLTDSLPSGTVSSSAQVIGILSSLNTATASFTPRITNLESKSASVDISITNINSFTASNSNESLNLKTGSYATTGSNTFFGTQTYSGSVYIANDLVVQGSSSIQYISASSVSIGTNIVQLNTANPSVRFAGLTIIDSGSIGGSGSFLYDSVQDEFIFVHRGNGTNVTSSHFVLGPETYDSLGNETYLTNNILPKGTGKEHLIDSCIIDNGITTCIKNNLVGTGTACFGSTLMINGNVGIGTANPASALLQIEGNAGGAGYTTYQNFLFLKNTNTAGSASPGVNLFVAAEGDALGVEFVSNGTVTSNGSAVVKGYASRSSGHIRITNNASCGSDFLFRTAVAGSTTQVNRMYIDSGGNTTFSNSVGIGGSPSDTIGYGIALDVQSSSGAALYLRDSSNPTTQYGFIAYDGNDNGLKINNENSSGFIRFNTAGSERMRITSGGNVVFNGGDANGWYAGFSNSSTNFAYMGATTQFANSGGSSTDFGIRAANSLAFYTSGGNERMRINSGGCVGIGTCTSNYPLDVLGGGGDQQYAPQTLQIRSTNGTSGQGTGIRISSTGGSKETVGILSVENTSATNGDMVFRLYNGGATMNEKMRITSGGSVSIGSASAAYNFNVYGASGADGWGAFFGGAGSTKGGIYIGNAGNQYGTLYFDNGNNNVYLKQSYVSGCVIVIANTGGVYLANGGTSWAAISSDVRKKKNFETTQGLAEVLQIEPIKYHFNEDDNNSIKRIGFKAQNIKPLIPEMVLETGEFAEDGSPYLTITSDYILPVLVKAIQEQQCTICSQASMINTLKTCLGII